MPFKQTRHGAAGLRRVPARQGRATDAQSPATPASVPPVQPSARAEVRLGARSRRDHRAAAGRNARHRRPLQRGDGGGRGGRGGRGGAAAPAPQPRRRRQRVLQPRWLDGAEVARLRSPLAQRAGRLPLHQVDARRRRSRAGPRRFRRVRRARPTRRTSRASRAAASASSRTSRDNMIPYTPEQLIALANKEFAWCEEEMKKASRALGFGDDWKKALEHTQADRRAARRPAAHDHGPARRGRRVPARQRSHHRAGRRRRDRCT